MHIGISSIGYPCERRIWYETRGYEPDFSRDTLRIFDIGNALEPVAVGWLRDEGYEIVAYNEGSRNAAFSVEIPAGEGIIRGHPDILLSRSDIGLCLGDIKTMNDQAFRKWAKGGTMAQYPQYHAQVSMYAYAAKMCDPDSPWAAATAVAIIGINKNTSEMRIEALPYREALPVSLCEKAARIFASAEPIVPADIPRWACGYCPFKEICDAKYASSTRAPVAEVDETYTEDDSLAFALSSLLSVREEKASLEALESELKKQIEAFLESNKSNRVRTPLYIAEREVSKRRTFDDKRLREDDPELHSKYIKTTEFTRLKINPYEE